MKCPYCDCYWYDVINTYKIEDERYQEICVCDYCGKIFKIEYKFEKVAKMDGE